MTLSRFLLERKRLPFVAALLMVAGLSCDRAMAPATTGGIDIVLLSPTGTSLAVVAPRPDDDRSVNLSGLSGNSANVLLDGVRVTVTGPTNKSQTVTTATGGFFQVTIDGLAPGSYAVVVEGLASGKVAHYGETTNIVVTAGNSTSAPVTFAVFQPVIPNPTAVDTVEVLRFTVSWTAVANAASYTVEWSTSPTMASPQSRSVTTTSTEINVTAEGKYYFTVRAVNANVALTGLPSAVKSTQVFQTVVTVAVTPASPTLTAGATQQFTFEARDADNVVVTNPPVLWVSNNHTVATISSTGLATTLTSGTAVISAVAKGTPGNATLTANPMAPTKLVFTTQPANTTAGQSMASIQVAIQNPQNQTASTDNTTQVTIAFGTNAGSGTLGGTKTVTVANGVASFTTLNVDRTGTGYTLTATSGTLTAATSTGFNITPAGASALAFIVQPSTVTAGSPISPAVQVEVRDGLGNRAVGANDPVAIAIGNNAGPGGVLSGTKTVNAINGVASFSGLSIDRNGTGYTLAASSGSLTGATSAAFNISAATQLAFATQPTNTVAGAAVSPALLVEIRDATGNRVSSARDAVTIAFGANPGSGTLAGTKTVNAIDGIATFTGLSVNRAASGYTLSASSGSLTAATSAVFNIAAGAVSRVGFTVEPHTVTSDQNVDVTVTTQDAFGNLVAHSTDIVIAIGNNPSGAALSGTTTVSITDGIAVFNDLQFDKTGEGYTLVATSATLASSATSNPFGVSPGAADHLAFIKQPGVAEPGGAMDEVQVAIVDAKGNQRLDAENITIALGANPGSGALTGTTTVQSVDGVATFLDVAVDSAGIGYTLSASLGGLVGTSDAFDVAIELTTVTAGDIQSCGLTVRGNAYCWGYPGVGAIGDGDFSGSSRPTPTRVIGGHTFSSISSGYAHVCAIRSTDSTAFCWGWNSNGQLGNGASDVAEPQAVTGGLQFMRISAGQIHTCGIAVDSLAYCWGQQGLGRLGNNQGASAAISTPTAVDGAMHFASISAGDEHTCGIIGDATAFCWGRQANGRLGNNLTVDASVITPTAVQDGHTFLEISAGGDHTCGVRGPATDRRGMCWGLNAEGQLGVAAGDFTERLVPNFVANSLKYRNIRASDRSSCGATVGGSGFCWGTADIGRLGNGITTGSFTVPQAVAGGLSFVRIDAATPGVSTFGDHTCGMTSSGKAYCWGGSDFGQSGDGTTLPNSVPVRVRGQRP